MILVCFQGKPSNMTVIYSLTNDAEEVEVEWFYEDLQYLLELTSKKRHSFHHKRLECKSRKSRDIWNNRQVWPWGKNEARQRLTELSSREHAGHSKHSFPTKQEMTLHMDITRWSILKSDLLHSFSQRWRSSAQLVKIRPVADYD